MLSADKLPPGFPLITQSPTTKVVEIGHNAVLVCSATGSPQPRISWVRNMLPVDTDNNPRYTILDSNMPGKIQHTHKLLYVHTPNIYTHSSSTTIHLFTLQFKFHLCFLYNCINVHTLLNYNFYSML